MTRKDMHSPASPEFDPAAYRCEGVYMTHLPAAAFDPWSVAEVQASRAAASALVEKGYTLGSGGPGKCGHCGAHMGYAALMVRDEAQQFIWVGETCLDNRFDLTKRQFDALRKTARLNRERANATERLAALLEAHPLLARLTEFPADAFLSDIDRKMRRDARLTENQIAAAERAVTRKDAQVVREAEWAARQQALVASGVRAPSGRTVVVGEVVSIKQYVDDYNSSRYGGYVAYVYKMLVQHAEGWKVWVSVPADLRDGDDEPTIAKGDTVRFTATLTPSEDDPTFAKGSRPTKASTLVAA
jgi:hypothetical protein